MTEDHPAVSVVTPTYNESLNIAELLDRLDSALAGLSHEIIVVDDDSPDRTWEVAEKVAEERANVRVIRRFHDRGLSSAVMAGMEVATGDTLAVIDADLQHDEAALPEMVEMIRSGEVDVCVGSRASDGGSYGEWSSTRRFVSWVATLIARLVLRVPTSDPMSGFFVVSRDAWQRTAPHINPKGFKILLEFIGRNPDLRVGEVGYTFRRRAHGETKLSGSVIRSYLIAVFELRLTRQLSARFYLYCLVGLSGVLVDLAVTGLGSTLGLPELETGWMDRLDPLAVGAIVGFGVSVVTNFLLNNSFTFWEYRYRGWSKLSGLALFSLVSLFGLAIQVSVAQTLDNADFLEGPLGHDPANALHASLGLAAALVSNYGLNANYTWRHRTE